MEECQEKREEGRICTVEGSVVKPPFSSSFSFSSSHKIWEEEKLKEEKGKEEEKLQSGGPGIIRKDASGKLLMASN